MIGIGANAMQLLNEKEIQKQLFLVVKLDSLDDSLGILKHIFLLDKCYEWHGILPTF